MSKTVALALAATAGIAGYIFFNKKKKKTTTKNPTQVEKEKETKTGPFTDETSQNDDQSQRGDEAQSIVETEKQIETEKTEILTNQSLADKAKNEEEEEAEAQNKSLAEEIKEAEEIVVSARKVEDINSKESLGDAQKVDDISDEVMNQAEPEIAENVVTEEVVEIEKAHQSEIEIASPKVSENENDSGKAATANMMTTDQSREEEEEETLKAQKNNIIEAAKKTDEAEIVKDQSLADEAKNEETEAQNENVNKSLADEIKEAEIVVSAQNEALKQSSNDEIEKGGGQNDVDEPMKAEEAGEIENETKNTSSEAKIEEVMTEASSPIEEKIAEDNQKKENDDFLKDKTVEGDENEEEEEEEDIPLLKEEDARDIREQFSSFEEEAQKFNENLLLSKSPVIPAEPLEIVLESIIEKENEDDEDEEEYETKVVPSMQEQTSEKEEVIENKIQSETHEGSEKKEENQMIPETITKEYSQEDVLQKKATNGQLSEKRASTTSDTLNGSEADYSSSEDEGDYDKDVLSNKKRRSKLKISEQRVKDTSSEEEEQEEILESRTEF